MPRAKYREFIEFVENISTMIETHPHNFCPGLSKAELFILKRVMVAPRFFENFELGFANDLNPSSFTKLFLINRHF
jgi:hypothetical protein